MNNENKISKQFDVDWGEKMKVLKATTPQTPIQSPDVDFYYYESTFLNSGQVHKRSVTQNCCRSVRMNVSTDKL